jgi:hypothetical protein
MLPEDGGCAIGEDAPLAGRRRNDVAHVRRHKRRRREGLEKGRQNLCCGDFQVKALLDDGDSVVSNPKVWRGITRPRACALHAPSTPLYTTST